MKERTAELEAVSLTDPLTGLNNRRYLHKLLPMDAARTQREYSRQDLGNPRSSALDLTFILLDIDYFKQVNDVYGHPAGDQVLIQLSLLLKKTLRESDYLIRWGGEEFLIVGRFFSRSEAGTMAERIRHAVENLKFDLGKDVLLKKTCSIGYATFPFIVSDPSLVSWEQVIDVADHALYVAKHLGRNQVIGISAPIKTKYEKFSERLAVNIDQMISDGELILTKFDGQI